MSLFPSDELNKIIPNNLNDHITESYGHNLKVLLNKFNDFKNNKCSIEDIIFESNVVIDYTWEQLNIGKWDEVDIKLKQTYSIAAGIQVFALLEEGKPGCILKSLKVTDLGILLGHPIGDLNLTKNADLLSNYLTKPNISTETNKTGLLPKNKEVKKIKIDHRIDSLNRPSLETFYNNYFFKKQPLKIVECMEHWPALRLWKDLSYIKSKAGYRTVPIEIGKHYVDATYGQKLMTVSEFIDEYFTDDAKKMGYLAQHNLFDQVPDLKKDIYQPEYCCLSDNNDVDHEPELNAWFGPAGTVSPLHFDPTHNILAQVVGSKIVTLYAETDSQYLYPHCSTLLFNTSQVDTEEPDLEKYPLFSQATKQQCLLTPGDMLYIPPKYWHHVRSLEPSFSVSFWWR